ncbi:MAG: ROK family protein [Acidobacteriota bacterium]
MASNGCAIGVDLGGTKIVTALVDGTGRVQGFIRNPTDVRGGYPAVRDQIIMLVKELIKDSRVPVCGIGIGVAGQTEPKTGLVRFAPNLDWHDAPLGEDLRAAMGLPVAVTNDVRAATWGEWFYGAGKGCDDLLCLFVGTGIGGGIVSGGRMLTGCSNTAGEVGHITVDINGPVCTCGKRGCMEAIAGGWAMGERARRAVRARPQDGMLLLAKADGDVANVTGKTVSEAFRLGDPLAREIIEETVAGLVAGAVSMVNAFNPCRIILGGGVIEGMPELVGRVDKGVREQALEAATRSLSVVRASLGNDAGVIGAAAFAMRSFQG